MKIINRLLIFLIIIFPINVSAFTLPQLHSKNVIIYDLENDNLLYESNSNERINIASLTKIMTTIVAIENIDDLNATVTYSQEMKNEIPWDASVAGLKVGDTVTYKDLLYASMLPSGADATTALAYGICGSSSKFVELMNKKAQDLGLTNTHFANVTGYDIENHYSTPKEVLHYLLYSLENDLFYQIYQTKSYTLSNGLLVLSTVQKYQNNLDYDLTQILGSKTGYTDAAGLCMSAILNIHDQNLLLLTFGAEVNKERTYHIEDTVKIINYLNENYTKKLLYKKNDILFSLPVSESNIDVYNVKATKDIFVYSIDEINKNDYHFEYSDLNKLSFRNKLGDKLGTINYYYNDNIATEDVFLTESINLSYLNLFKDNPLLLMPFLIVLLLLIFIILYKKKKRKTYIKR